MLLPLFQNNGFLFLFILNVIYSCDGKRLQSQDPSEIIPKWWSAAQ